MAILDFLRRKPLLLKKQQKKRPDFSSRPKIVDFVVLELQGIKGTCFGSSTDSSTSHKEKHNNNNKRNA